LWWKSLSVRFSPDDIEGAEVINHLLSWKCPQEGRPVERVSPRMLYHMARIYDEWAGEDYEGSSCRGAMKGWHRHGVCTERKWPYYDRRGRARFLRPKAGWEQEAAARPLGAYYRVNKDSIADLQAAIHEVGAVYVSAAVHDGWFLEEADTLPKIPMMPGETGGHAFALVGYRPDGFIVQNSWGRSWGYGGFALMTYEDWVEHGSDAWVAVLGAPMSVEAPPTTVSSYRLRDVADGKAEWSWRSDRAAPRAAYHNRNVEPLSEDVAYRHTVVLGNNGRALNRFLYLHDAADAVREAAFRLPLDWLRGQSKLKLVIYAHGGLNDEETSVKRIRVMAPYFRDNEIYPLFVTWKTGLMESMVGMLEDVAGRFFAPRGIEPARGWLTDLEQQISEARDRTIEVACEQLLIKPVWMQMKQNAEAAAAARAGVALLAAHLLALKKELPKLEVHLIGHSAGSILLGHLLTKLGARIKTSSLSLYAPACTVEFALSHYGRAVQRRALTKNRIYCDLLDDERERADSVGPYGKSLLYLVSRALETVHKMPILGMHAAWSAADERQDIFGEATRGAVDKWRKFAGSTIEPTVHTRQREMVWDGREHIPLAHGSFDNDVEVVTRTLERIRGAKLKAAVESLHGF
jgi:hypothetical protein